MMAANMAPGMNRSFLAESWTHIISRKEWYACMDEAAELVDFSQMPDIQGYDIDDEMVRIARENAKLAGVEQYIHFQRRGIEALSHPKSMDLLLRIHPMENGWKIKYDRIHLPDTGRALQTAGFLVALYDHFL